MMGQHDMQRDTLTLDKIKQVDGRAKYDDGPVFLTVRGQ